MTSPPRIGGRLRSKPGRKLHLADYLRETSQLPPLTIDYSPAALPALRRIDLNQSLGDCVIAAGDHLVGVWTGNAGQPPWQPTDGQVLADYEAIGGYVPGQPKTDRGADERTALDYWQAHGFRDGSPLTAWCSVNPGDQAEVERAVWLFEGLLLGMELPDPWITPFPSADGFVWDALPPDPSNGHAVCAVGYSAEGLKIATWGLLGTLTWPALASLCAASAGGELYALLSPSIMARASQRSPEGLDWEQLQADFAALTPPRGATGCALGRAWRRLLG